MNHDKALNPATSPSAEDLFNMHQQISHGITNVADTQQAQANSFNPYQPVQESTQDNQDKFKARTEEVLSPIASNQYDINDHHTDEKQEAFEKNWMNDPAGKEVHGEMMDVLEGLRQGIVSGQVSMQQAKEIYAQWGKERFDPAFNKHHGKDSDSHKRSFHDTTWIKE